MDASKDFKECNRCHRHLPPNTDFFYRCSAHEDGLQNTCKDCTREYQAARRKKKRYSERPTYDYKHHPDRYHARQAIYHLMRNGWLIKRGRCSVAGCNHVVTEFHHDDYSYPLDVIELCKRHHKIRTEQLNSGTPPAIPDKNIWSDPASGINMALPQTGGTIRGIDKVRLLKEIQEDESESTEETKS